MLKKSRKQRASHLMSAAKRIFYGKTCYSCNAVRSASKSIEEAREYAKSVGVRPDVPAFGFKCNKYTGRERKLARELAILIYREAVLAGKA